MYKNKSNGLSGDLNYIVTDYLSKIPSLKGSDNVKLLEKLKENLNFGEMYDMDLQRHPCNYQMRKDIYERVEQKTLSEIYGEYADLGGAKEEGVENAGRENGILVTTKKMPAEMKNGFRMMTKARTLEKKDFDIRDLQMQSVKSFKHMKSMLGHISVVEENVINPVAIYCLSYSKDKDLIFTGDDNGVIKIWSSRTGALVEIFKSHEKAINDTLLIKGHLISCSEDMSVKIWDVERLSLVKTLNFDESIGNVLSYDYLNKKTKKNQTIIIASSVSGKLFIFDLNKIIPLSYDEQGNPSPPEYENEAILNKVYFDKKIYEKYPMLKKVKNSLQHTCMAAHNRSGILVCGFNEGLICVWDLEKILDAVIMNDKFIFEFEKYLLFLEYAHNSLIQISEFNKLGNYFISASVDGNVLIWKILDDVLAQMRVGVSSSGLYPIYSIFKLTEDENRIRSCVNAATWSSKNNYIIALISSRKKKKAATGEVKTNIQTTNTSSGVNNTNSNASNNISDHRNESVYKRTSAILVYDLNSNSAIRRYDSENGFPFHDECYVLESHPVHEEIILTVTNTNEVLLFNFLSGEILCKFMEENYFFNNISHNMIASEGKFSPTGDSFVISTYLGSISIYSTYSKNSFTSTYMNQFFNEEFASTNSLGVYHSDPDNPFKTYVNMYNLPYIAQQPLSGFKINQLEKSTFKRLIDKYNYSLKEIHHKLLNNYECYEKNLEERQFECEREERIFSQVAKENLAYMIQENVMDNDDYEEEANEESSEYNSQEEVGLVGHRNYEEEDVESISNSQMMEIDDLEHGEAADAEGSYNLRSRRSAARENDGDSNTGVTVRNRVLRSRRRGSGYSNNINTNIRRDNSARRTLRNRFRRGDYNENNSEEESVEWNAANHVTRSRLRERNNINNISLQSNTNANNNSRRRLGQRARKKSYRRRSNSEEVSVDYENEAMDVEVDKEEIDLQSSEIPNNISEFGSTVKELYMNCKDAENICFLCKFYSKSLLGPFITEDYKNFKTETSAGSDESKNSKSFEILNEMFYFHTDCLLTYNDFIVRGEPSNTITTRRSYNTYYNGNNNINSMKSLPVNLPNTIKLIIEKEQKCWRCQGDYATKKCSNNKCNRFFHGHYCLQKYCIEGEENLLYCLECYKAIFSHIDEKAMLVTKNTGSKLKYNEMSREFFEKTKFSFYSYFPQLGHQVYFILQSYEDYLRNSFENIIYELNQEERIFFWNDEEDSFDYTKPFLCEVIGMDLAFACEQTNNLLKRLYNSDWQKYLKIIVKLRLRVIDTGKQISLIFMENELPDFLVDKQNFENNYKEYLRLLKEGDGRTLNVVIEDIPYPAEFVKLENKENNERYKDSLFENLFVEYSHDNKEVMRVSFWELHQENLQPYIKHELIQNLLDKIEEVYNKGSNKYSFFLQKVDEERDGAFDYYNIITIPMYMELIKERLRNNYYVSFASIEYDICLIKQNACTYNTPNSDIAKYSVDLAKQLINFISHLKVVSGSNNLGDFSIVISGDTLPHNQSNSNISFNLGDVNISSKRKGKIIKELDTTKETFLHSGINSNSNINSSEKRQLRRRSNTNSNNINNISNFDYPPSQWTSTLKGSSGVKKGGLLIRTPPSIDPEKEESYMDLDAEEEKELLSVSLTSQSKLQVINFSNVENEGSQEQGKYMLRNKRKRPEIENNNKFKFKINS